MKGILTRLRGVLGSAIAWGSAWFTGGLIVFLSFGLIETVRRSRWDIWGTSDLWFRVLWFAGWCCNARQCVTWKTGDIG